MAKRGSPESRELLQDALLESNLEKLPEKIAHAEVDAYRRIEQMKANPGAKVRQSTIKLIRVRREGQRLRQCESQR